VAQQWLGFEINGVPGTPAGLEESGAVDEVSGIPHSYSCTDGSGLYRDPSRGTTWHIELSPKASNGSLRSVALIGAWY
jgi:hypothetical protein